jgi:hypothetical protein
MAWINDKATTVIEGSTNSLSRLFWEKRRERCRADQRKE